MKEKLILIIEESISFIDEIEKEDSFYFGD